MFSQLTISSRAFKHPLIQRHMTLTATYGMYDKNDKVLDRFFFCIMQGLAIINSNFPHTYIYTLLRNIFFAMLGSPYFRYIHIH
jgi:hypothetical protein